MRARFGPVILVAAALGLGFGATIAELSWWSSRADAAVVARDLDHAPLKSKRLRGGGGWRRAGRSGGANQRWQLDLQRNDENRLSGRVSLGGSPLAGSGVIDGKIDKREVTGSITDDSGRWIADFRGIIGGNGISGKYTDRSGESGDWSWEGALPQ